MRSHPITPPRGLRPGQRPLPLAARMLQALVAAAVAVAIASGAAFASGEPPVPAVPPPSGTPVAILGPGIDYRQPDLASRLARDGEGDLVGWDFRDADNRPFAASDASPAVASANPAGSTSATHDATALARAMLAANPDVSLIVIREKPGDAQAFGHMMSFAARTPVRILVWPDAHPARPDWPILLEAVNLFTGHLFILPAVSDAGASAATALRRLRAVANVIFVPAPPGPAQSPESVSQQGPEAGARLARAAAAAARIMAGGEARPIAEIALELRAELATADVSGAR